MMPHANPDPFRCSVRTIALLLPAASVATAIAGCVAERSVGEDFADFESTADQTPACAVCEARVAEVYGPAAAVGNDWAPSASPESPPTASPYRPEKYSGIHTITDLAFDDFGHLYATGVVDPAQNSGGHGLFLHFDETYSLVGETPTNDHLWVVESDGREVYVGGQVAGPSEQLYASDSRGTVYRMVDEALPLEGIAAVDGAAVKALEIDDRTVTWAGWLWQNTPGGFHPGVGTIELHDLGGGVGPATPVDDYDVHQGEVLDMSLDELGRRNRVGWMTQVQGPVDRPDMWFVVSSQDRLVATRGSRSAAVAVVPVQGGFSLALENSLIVGDIVEAPFVYSAYDDQDGHIGVGGLGGPDIVPTISRAAAAADDRRVYQVVRVDNVGRFDLEVWEINTPAMEVNRRIRIPVSDLDVFAVAVAPDDSIVLGGRQISTNTPWIGRYTMNGIVPIE